MLPRIPHHHCAETITGHVFAGPSLPYAMAKPVADVLENNRGGFAPDGEKVSGYSHMHDDGIGGVCVPVTAP